jgi:hypothetical protein
MEQPRLIHRGSDPVYVRLQVPAAGGAPERRPLRSSFQRVTDPADQQAAA